MRRTTIGIDGLRATVRAAIAMGALSAAMQFSPASALALNSVPLPFGEGETARIIQGYNGGTHQGPSVYGLDLVLTRSETSGAAVLSPLAGSVAWAFDPGDRTGCIQVNAPDGRFGVMLCHIVLDRPYRRGERVSRGQVLGTVGASGQVGNNGTPHVHLELHQGGSSKTPVPFGGPEGLPLEDRDLPFTGAPGDHGGEGQLVSTNSFSDPPPAAAPTRIPARSAPSASLALMRLSAGQRAVADPPATTLGANFCVIGTAPRFSGGFADVKSQLRDAMGDPLTCESPDPNGSGDVHQETTSGLAFWRKSTNTAMFTNGTEHWAYTAAGLLSWSGSAVDPPLAG